MRREIWVVDDDESIGWVIQKALIKQGHEVLVFSLAQDLLDELANRSPSLIISDIRMPGMNGFELLNRINDLAYTVPVVIMTAFGDLDSAVDAFKQGAFEYLTKPFDLRDLVSIVERSLSENIAVQTQHEEGHRPEKLVGESICMKELRQYVDRLSSSTAAVLVRGESGTGKGLVAKMIHENSPRSNRPMVSINISGISAELLETELFGREKGSDRVSDRHPGRLEQTHGGTLFLDEIGDMPLAVQTRLLHVLSEGRFYRVGGREEIKVDVRIIAATNQNLEQLIELGKFRSDLFYRLNIITLGVPPLRERDLDIGLLVNHFLARCCEEQGVEPKRLKPGFVEKLCQYPWPGNVRELENLVYRLTLLVQGSEIGPSDLPAEMVNDDAIAGNYQWQTLLLYDAKTKIAMGQKKLIQSMGNDFEQVLIQAAMEHTGGHKINSAELLGWGRNTLTRKLKA